MKIAYHGIRGSYSEQAIYQHFGKEVNAIGYLTFEKVFEAVNQGEVDLGFLPFENSIAGSITRNYDLLLQSDVFICHEVFLRIKHNLLSQRGNTIEQIKSVHSHPQAIEQCRDFIQENELDIHLEYDTAGAAKLISERKLPEQAAIASEFCAEIYDLEIITQNIARNKFNVTKFLGFVQKEKTPHDLKMEKTSIAFKTKHRPGALISCLQRFSKNNVNLTKLESRPIPENPWEYVFFADLEGAYNDEKVKLSISEIEASSVFVKVLGSYPMGNKPSPEEG